MSERMGTRGDGVMTKWYVYRQNNSGGSFDVDEVVGRQVWFEAEDPTDADTRAESVGLYFDDECLIDCQCCGPRWSRAGGQATDTADEVREEHSGTKPFLGPAVWHLYYVDGTHEILGPTDGLKPPTEDKCADLEGIERDRLQSLIAKYGVPEQ